MHVPWPGLGPGHEYEIASVPGQWGIVLGACLLNMHLLSAEYAARTATAGARSTPGGDGEGAPLLFLSYILQKLVHVQKPCAQKISHCPGPEMALAHAISHAWLGPELG